MSCFLKMESISPQEEEMFNLLEPESSGEVPSVRLFGLSAQKMRPNFLAVHGLTQLFIASKPSPNLTCTLAQDLVLFSSPTIEDLEGLSFNSFRLDSSLSQGQVSFLFCSAPALMAGHEGKSHPDCINSSNPYHECSEYCYGKIAEAKAKLGFSSRSVLYFLRSFTRLQDNIY